MILTWKREICNGEKETWVTRNLRTITDAVVIGCLAAPPRTNSQICARWVNVKDSRALLRLRLEAPPTQS